MNVTVVGGGNIGTQFAVHCAAKGHKVIIYSPKYKLFETELEIVNGSGELILGSEIALATNDPKKAFGDADLIFVTTPAFLANRLFSEMQSYIGSNTYIGFVPGTGGMECVFKDCLKKGCKIFGLQRVPSVARLVQYGKKVCAEGYRQRLFVAALPSDCANDCSRIIEDIFNIPCDALPNYLNLTLTPSNPILHTTRLFTLFKDYCEGKYYQTVPLFYEDWDLRTSELLFLCDSEVQNICKKLVGFDLSYVKSLKEHYESQTAEQLVCKIKSIVAFKGIETPMVKTDKGYVPDFSSRYFVSDFAYGLTIIQQIAHFVKVNTPEIDKLLKWFVGLNISNNCFDFRDYAIMDMKDFLEFYAS